MAEERGTPYAARRDRDWLHRTRRGGAVRQGHNYLHRPGELLVAAQDLHMVEDNLRRARASRDPRQSAELEALGVLRYQLPETDQTTVETFVAEQRVVHPRTHEIPAITPNHVFAGAQTMMGGPGAPPRPAPALPEMPPPAVTGPGAFEVQCFDTGVAGDVHALHPVLAARLVDCGTDDLDDDGDGWLDYEAGHGTFVAGIVNRLLPSVSVSVARVLEPDGLGDEVTVALAVAASRSRLLNLSLYGYTHDDVAPVLLTRAIDALPRDVAVVAAAGNEGSDRPAWPAAHKRVIAVGALDAAAGEPRRAEYSNHGWWVDCAAPGVDVWAPYVAGRWRLDDGEVRDFAGWATWTGTSFAAPQVAAMIAARALERGISPRQAGYELLGDEGRPWLPDVGVVLRPEVDVCAQRSPADDDRASGVGARDEGPRSAR